jgi:hypothetical protein
VAIPTSAAMNEAEDKEKEKGAELISLTLSIKIQRHDATLE